MIRRLVKMRFQPGKAQEFIRLSQGFRPRIVGFDGCLGLEIWQDLAEPQNVFSFSRWESPEQLDAYRRSDFFRQTWATYKPWFEAPAQAWSLDAV